MKKILAALILLTSAVNMFADVTVYGEVKGSATKNFNDEYYAEDYEGTQHSGEDSEMEARIGIKGSNGVTSFNVQLKATDGGPNDEKDHTYPYFEYGYIKTDVAEFFGFDGFILDVTAGLVKVEGLRKARYTTYQNEDFPVQTRAQKRTNPFRFQIRKNVDAPNVLLDAGIDLIRFRGGMSTAPLTNYAKGIDGLQYMAGVTGNVESLGYEAYYMNTGVYKDTDEAADEEEGDNGYIDAIMASVWYDKLEAANLQAKFGGTYMYTVEEELHSFGGGFSITEETLLPVELSLGIDGAYVTTTDEDDKTTSELEMYDLAIELDTELTDWFSVLAGSVIDLRDYSEMETTQPGALRMIEVAASFQFGKTSIQIGRCETFDVELMDDDSAYKTAETMFSYAEDTFIPHFYINVKSKF